ncbi:hypothetical protein ACIBEK_13625 [Nocardia fusca]|jgi:hypothetical protein|uniref:Integral membrane protein n=3 Tax=Nocardia TaxID=1817 RepID=A0ABV3FA08_9NOCA|nr:MULTISPECIES: hypothetical protein [Nocardia]MCX0274350.1 hypothetical protein [Nocardia zapadnayensis]
MLVLTLALATIGLALLILSLATGSVIWAWGCIAVCVAGAVVLLASALSMRAPDEELPPRDQHAKR